MPLYLRNEDGNGSSKLILGAFASSGNKELRLPNKKPPRASIYIPQGLSGKEP